jgi:hypothetical protein
MPFAAEAHIIRAVGQAVTPFFKRAVKDPRRGGDSGCDRRSGRREPVMAPLPSKDADGVTSVGHGTALPVRRFDPPAEIG